MRKGLLGRPVVGISALKVGRGLGLAASAPALGVISSGALSPDTGWDLGRPEGLRAAGGAVDQEKPTVLDVLSKYERPQLAEQALTWMGAQHPRGNWYVVTGGRSRMPGWPEPYMQPRGHAMWTDMPWLLEQGTAWEMDRA